MTISFWIDSVLEEVSFEIPFLCAGKPLFALTGGAGVAHLRNRLRILSTDSHWKAKTTTYLE